MATEVIADPPASREHLTISSATDVISGILSNAAAESEPEPEAPPAAAIPETPDEASEPEPEPTAAEEPLAEDDDEATEPAPQEAKTEESDQDSQEDADAIELEPSQLAGLLGLEENDLAVDDDGNVSINIKADGEVSAVSLADLRESHQLAKTHRQRLSQLGEERKAFETERGTLLEGLANQTNQMAQAIEQLEAEYAADFQAVDWNTLRAEDPTEYNLKRTDYEDRRRRLEEHQAGVRRARQEVEGQAIEQARKAQTEGAAKLDEIFSSPAYSTAPKWDDEAKKATADWIIEQGFTPEQVNANTSWQLFKWARDSMLREAELKQAKKTVRRIVKLPKITKPGPKKSTKAAKRTKVDESRSRMRKQGGDLRSVAAHISELMKS